jgi:hypothetical protein
MNQAKTYAASMRRLSLSHSELAAKGGPSTAYHVKSSTQLAEMADAAEDQTTALGKWLAALPPEEPKWSPPVTRSPFT